MTVLSMSLLAVLARPLEAESIRALPAAGGVSDGDLVRRALQGDRWAEEAIYRRHVRYVGGIVVRLLRNRTEAEDVLQDTFAIALERLRTLRDPDALRAWIGCIAVSQVRRRFRRRKLMEAVGLGRFAAQPPGDGEDATLESLASEGQSPEIMAELGKLDRALARLPDDERIAWMLRHVEGEALEDVAAACACSLATVKRRIAAADAAVRRHVSLGESASVGEEGP